MESDSDFDHEILKANLNHLLQGKIGLSYFQPSDISTVTSECCEKTAGFKNYHLSLDIPYAGKKLNWHVIFDPEDLLLLPDFDFNDDRFLPEPDYDFIVELIPHWEKWNLQDPTSLLSILNEFLNLYKKNQVDKLSIDNIYERYKNEFKELCTHIPYGNIQVNVDNHLSFLIEIPIDCSSLPEYVQSSYGDYEEFENPGEDFMHLTITILKLDNSSNKVLLFNSPRLDQILGKISIPTFRKNSTLLEYVTKLETMIKAQIELVVLQFNARKEFILGLAALYCNTVVEYDKDTYTQISFIYQLEDCEDYHCLVNIKLGAKFPHERPKVRLISIYCQEEKQCNQNFDNFIYNSSDSMEDNVNRIARALKVGAMALRDHTH